MSSAKPSFPHAIFFKIGIVVLGIALIPLARFGLRHAFGRFLGKYLNAYAWEATYRERHVPIPPQGPRDGYWAERLVEPVKDPLLGWRNREAHVPGRIDIDSDGLQRVINSSKPKNRI